jgi:hypothetical protein
MPFPESVKKEAKRRANYRCVVCQQPFVEVHHIIPDGEGPDTVDNAAPLCGGCHHRYGGNPELRKQLREMRDWWWERCAATGHITVDAGLAQRFDQLQSAMLQGQKRQDEVLSEVKTLVLQQISQVQQQVITSGSISGVFQATRGLASGLPTAKNTDSLLLSQLELNILEVVGRRERVTAREVAAAVHVSEQKAKFYLDELDRRHGLIDWYGNMNPGEKDHYMLRHAGRKLLVERDML